MSSSLARDINCSHYAYATVAPLAWKLRKNFNDLSNCRTDRQTGRHRARYRVNRQTDRQTCTCIMHSMGEAGRDRVTALNMHNILELCLVSRRVAQFLWLIDCLIELHWFSIRLPPPPTRCNASHVRGQLKANGVTGGAAAGAAGAALNCLHSRSDCDWRLKR